MSELRITSVVTYTKNGRTLAWSPQALEVDLTGNPISDGVMDALAASAADVPLGNVGTPGIGIFQNLGAHAIQLGYDDTGFVVVATIPVGLCVIVPLDTLLAAPQVKAVTTDSILGYMILPAIAAA